MQTIQSRLSHNYAVREINKLDQLRLCAQANSEGLTQTEIARKLFVSQPEVHRILKRITAFPDLLERTPHEVILEFHAERIEHDSMMTELINWPYTFSTNAEPNNPEGQLARGSWDEILDAFHRDLIDAVDYQRVRDAVWGQEAR
ncbi:MarR family transcriptional regulator [Glutamicibacter sp. AOP5-A2-18]|uniref:MarR family transcriptional regulator n=1 Tax=Glutamicibacter sp. AOP5-A2-18 TaxID=3457656 RepID=UPI004033ED59